MSPDFIFWGEIKSVVNGFGLIIVDLVRHLWGFILHLIALDG